MMENRDIHVYFLGRVPYADGLQLQKEIHGRVVDKKQVSSLLFLEHPPVLTLGKNASNRDVLVTMEELEREGIDLEHVDRGGEATAHEPGQLVVYPILDLRTFQLGPKVFVNRLEDVVIKLLAEYGLSAYRDAEFPGVWVKDAKICSVGFRISRGVSYHGIALNVSNTLDTFSKIVPCGIQNRGLTTLARLVGKELLVTELAERFLQIFRESFAVAAVTYSRKTL